MSSTLSCTNSRFCRVLEILRNFQFNPKTYGILRFRQLRGRELFGPDPENKVTVIGSIRNLLPIMVRMILVNMKNLQLLAVLILEICRHKNFLSRREQVVAIRYLPPGIEQNSKKSLYMPENIFSGTILYPSAFPWFSSKTKKSYQFNFSRRLISKTTAAIPLVNRFC